MNRYYKVTVKFDPTEETRNIIAADFDITKLNFDGTMEFFYHGNSRSTENSAINGTRQMLSKHHLIGHFTIIGAAEK